jgi:hypothetical protein
MARNRVIYQSEALYVSKEATSVDVGDHEQLERVQSANYNFNISRQDVNQFGQLGKIGSMVLEAPTVSVDTSYLVTDGFNERALGFHVQTGDVGGTSQSGSFISGFLGEGSGKNLYIATVPEGTDALGVDTSGAGNDFIGLGNVYLSDYTLDLSVGSLPTVSVSFEAANIASSAGEAAVNPAVNQADGSAIVTGSPDFPPAIQGVSDEVALRPGDIEISIENITGGLANIGGGDTGAHIQSASLSIPLSRSPIERLGTKFAYARPVEFPVQATLSVNAIVNEMTVTNLANEINDEDSYELNLTLKAEDGAPAMVYTILGAQLVSESFSSSIGSNKSVDLTFTTSLGGPSDLNNGVFVSGANVTKTFQA